MGSSDGFDRSVRFAVALTLFMAMGATIGWAQPLPNIVEQFQKIQHNGAGLAFDLGVGDDPYLWETRGYCRHYQGLARMDLEGISYFFLTRNGNYSFPGCDSSWNNPSELLVVKMGSRDSDGERLRSNRLAVGTTEGGTLPPVDDIGVAHIHFTDGAGEPGWMHPGGVQLVDGVLVIPMKFYCTAFSDVGIGQGVAAYDCTGGTVSGAAGLVFVDVSDPLSPSVLKDVDLGALGATDGYGAVAAIREPAGKYLFATMKGPDDWLDFWRSTDNTGGSGTDLRTTGWDLEWVGSWHPNALEPGTNPETAGWWDWQFINFLRDSDGALYLITGDNTGAGNPFPEPVMNGADWIRLFQVIEHGHELPEEGEFRFRLDWAGGDRASSERQLETEYPQMGNLEAAGVAYVSPTGQLIVYTAHHMRYFQDGTWYVAMGEYRNIDVHVSTTEAGLPPRLEVVDVDGDGQNETSCSGWIELYENEWGWDENGSPKRGTEFDYRDRHLRDWSNLHAAHEFGDETTALRWNLPPGQRALLFEHAGYGGLVRNPIPEGTGSVGNLGSWWNDEIISVRLTPVADIGDAYFIGDPGEGIALEHANPCYFDEPPDDPPIEFQWAIADEACEPIVEEDCTISDTTALRPNVTCEAGQYWIRLEVEDTLSLDDSQFPWPGGPESNDLTDAECALLYVPEPSRWLLLAAGVGALLLMRRISRQR